MTMFSMPAGTNNFISGQGANYSALPTVGDHTGEVWVVLTGTGVWLINRKPAGLYYSDGVNWVHLAAFPDSFDSLNLKINDNGDATKLMEFDLTNITTGNTRTLVMDDQNVDLRAFSEMNEPTGFPNRTDSTLSWSDSSPDRTLTIAPASSSFSFWQDGKRYLKTSSETHQIGTDEGLHYIYYDAGSLASTANPTFGEQFIIVTLKVLVSIIYWDATNSTGIYVGEERHGITMDGDTHANLHFSVGLKWYQGLALNSILADQNGSSNTHAQFGVDAGSVADEDLGLSLSAITSTTGLPVYWRTGGDGDWRKTVNAGYSFLITGTKPSWNQLTGGVWQQTECGDKDFVLVHVFATTEKDKPIIAIMGQAVYEKKKDAREGATTEVGNLLLGNLPGPEITPLASVIFECKDSYTNTVNARVVTTDEGDDYVDWRTSEITRTAAGGDHGSLGGLSDDDHPQYELIAGRAEQVLTTTDANYTVLDADNYNLLLFDTGNTTRTCTLPTAADNAGRKINIKKIDSGTGAVTIDGEGAETIDDVATQSLPSQYDAMTIQCDGTEWWIL